MEPQIQYCTTRDGVSIAYYTIGSGPPLIWLPGLPSHLQLEWKVTGDLYEDYAKHHTLVRFDWRGTGLSQRAAAPTVEGMAIDIEAIHDQLGGGTISLFVQGASSIAGLLFAAGRGNRIRRLVLWECYSSRDDLGSQMNALDGLARSDYNMFIETLARTVLGWANNEQAAAYAPVLRAAMVPEGWLAFLTQPYDSVEPLLPRITCPTLVVHNRDASLVPMEAIQRLVSGIPGARLAILDGSSVGETTRSSTVVRDFFLPDEAPAIEPAPTAALAHGGTRTILFTDIVGHTEMMQRLGDAKGRDVLREHERITRETLKAHGGAEVKTMGDGFMASFGSVTSAVECAIALQRGFAAALTPGLVAGARPSASATEGRGELISIRVGLNAGEPIEEDGDLFGATVILASRIAAKAGAGEILIPEPVRHLLSGKSFVFSDKGEHAMKGFDDAVRLYEVRWRE